MMRTLETTVTRRLARSCLAAIVVLSMAGCGGGGSGGGGGGGGNGPACSKPNFGDCIVTSNGAGSTTLTIDNINLTSDGTARSLTAFTVILATASGAPVVNAEVFMAAGAGLAILSPEGALGRTDSTGTLTGEIQGIAGGGFVLSATPGASTGLPLARLSVAVSGSPPPSVPSSTPTQGTGPTSPPGPTQTPTVVDISTVAKLVVQVQPFVIKSALGGDVTVTVLAFDANNLGVSGVRLLLDADPRPGTSFDPLTPITNSNGIATSTLHIEPGAEVGEITVSASGGAMISDSTTIRVVSGISERPAATIVLESDQPVIGTDSGGTASLKARVFDADNIGIPDVNVLFTSEVGQITPPVEITCGGEVNPCPPTDVGLAQTTLTVPPNAVIREYQLTASSGSAAGGVTGTATISIVAGRGGTGTGNPNAAAGEPASITLGASPPAIQVSGTGGVEQATIIARMFDNNNNPLSSHVVALRVVPAVEGGARMLPLSGTQPPLPQKCLEDPARQLALDEGRLALGVTDRAGFVLASVRAGTLKGTVAIEACADSVNSDDSVTTVVSQQTVVTVAPGAPAVVNVVMNEAFIDNNDGTFLTTAAALVKDANGNTVEDNTAVGFSITNRQDVSIVGASTTNNLPECDIDQFPGQTGLAITAQPGTAITCVIYPSAQSGSIVSLKAVSGTVSNEDNGLEDEVFSLPPGSTSGPAGEVPSAHNFSLASQFLNLSGRVTFNLSSTLTAFVADRFGNPVQRNTRVTFTTEGGGVTSSSLTNLFGRASATLTTQGAVPNDGIVIVTASVQGEEDFIDVNGDGQFQSDVDVFDPAIHDQDGNGVWSANTTIRTQIPVVFSGATRIEVDPTSFSLNPGEVACFDVFVGDAFGNPIVGGSTVSATVAGSLTLLGSPIATVPDSNHACAEAPGACNFTFCVFPSTTVSVVTTAAVTFSVSSSELDAGGNGGASTGVIGDIQPPAPLPTPEPTPTP